MHILLVEDDKKAAAFVAAALKADGYVVSVLHNGDEALVAALGGGFDAMVLDIMLHGRDGLSVLKQLRAQRNTMPVLLCSARNDANERVEGLDTGADDYLGKPFVLEELLARVRALLRRGRETQAARVLSVADLTLDTQSRTAQRNGRAIGLTTREFQLLEYLMRSSPRVCTRMMILENVWEYSFDPGSNIVDAYILKLRKKIDGESGPRLLHSVRGAGYVLKEQL